jgi:hypothetical protein
MQPEKREREREQRTTPEHNWNTFWSQSRSFIFSHLMTRHTEQRLVAIDKIVSLETLDQWPESHQ